MKKELEITDEEKIDHLAEEIRAILSEAVFSARLTLLEAKHLVGKTIVENTLYKRWKKGSGDLIKELAKRLGRSDRDLYLCVEFYSRFRKIEQAVQSLKGKKNEITWSAVRRFLEGKREEKCVHQWEEINCWQCKICGQFRKNEPLK